MKNFFRLLLLFSATVTVIFSLSSCIVVDNPVVFRVPFEELKAVLIMEGVSSFRLQIC